MQFFNNISLLMLISHCIGVYSFMHGSLKQKMHSFFFFAKVRFINISKNQLIQIKAIRLWNNK